jgi:hypothetical protein
VLHNKPQGCGASGALADGPYSEEEEEEEEEEEGEEEEELRVENH